MDPNIADLFQREGVTFVGKGKKIVDGKQTDEDAIIIGVEEKKPKSELTKNQILPSFVSGQKTDIVQTGVIKKRSYEEARRTEKSRPIQPGTSCGHYAISAGSFGSVVYADVEVAVKKDIKSESFFVEFLMAFYNFLKQFLKGHDLIDLPPEEPEEPEPPMETKAYILSNNHVLANENKASLGDPIRQPGTYDGGTKNDVVAVLSEFVPISRSKTNYVDCAIAEITVDYVPEILDIGVPKGTADIEVGEYITKSGRTTGTTRAKVIAVDAYTRVEYDMGLTSWEGQIITGRTDDDEPSSDGGDSGSLGVDDNGYAVGLLAFGSDEITGYNPIGEVLSALKTKVHF